MNVASLRYFLLIGALAVLLRLKPAWRIAIILLGNAIFLLSQGPWAAAGVIFVQVALFLLIRALNSLVRRKSLSKGLAAFLFFGCLLLLFWAHKTALASAELQILFFSYSSLQLAGLFINTVLQDERELAASDFFAGNLFLCNVSSGPIEDISRVSAQIRVPARVSVIDGARLLVSGLFKKTVADLCSTVMVVLSDNILDSSKAIFFVLFLLTRTYCDFSGYTDLARGSAKLLGIELNLNFRNPYLATNLLEFWNRWHISLGQWCKMNVFYPLFTLLSRRQFPEWAAGALSIFLTFLFVGLWHQFNQNFLIWAVLNTVLISALIVVRPYLGWVPPFFGVVATLFQVIALDLIAHTDLTWTQRVEVMNSLVVPKFVVPYPGGAFFWALLIFGTPVLLDYLSERFSKDPRWVALIASIQVLCLISLTTNREPFIYGRF